jgi:hypothetical protein
MGHLPGWQFAAFLIGNIWVHSSERSRPGISNHFPQAMGNGPLFREGHFAEALHLNGAQWFEGHSFGIP